MKYLVWFVIFTLFLMLPVLTAIKMISLTKNSPPHSLKQQQIHNERGPIFDRNGNILAMQVKSWNVGLRLIDTDNPKEVQKILSKVLHIPIETIKEKLKIPNKYVRIKKHITKDEYNAINTLKKEGKLNGVQFSEITWRKYPGKESLAHLIGYYGEEGKGLDGIEISFNKELQATQEKPLGNSIYLTIDSILQSSIEEIIKETLIESKASFINTILMNGKTGEILAFASLPSFDINNYYTYPQEKLSNKLIRFNYEPGSVFKVFAIASLLDYGSITPYSTFNASSPYVNKQYGYTIQDIWYPGTITTSEIIKYSSNVGTARASETISDTVFYKYLQAFGFGKKTGIQLPGENYGILKDTKYWSKRSKPTIALGQEIAVTALQLVTAATALVNNGYLLTPQVVKKIVSPEGKTVYVSQKKEKEKILKNSTASTILRMMNNTTSSGGTAHRLKIEGIDISAKTGTAQVFDVTQKQYSKNNFIASTLSIIPTQNPELIIYAAIHNPTSGEIYGGRTTAPMIRKMLKFILPYLGYLEETKEEEIAQIILHKQKVKKTNIRLNTVYENYIGKSKREIWSLFINTDIQLELYGNGTVVRQDPAPNTRIENNKTLHLYFK